MGDMATKVRVEPREAVELSATDSLFYSHYFFPKTVRQGSAPFHADLWDLFENPANRYVSAMIYRDGAKTTIARLVNSKRIAFGLSRTMVYVGKNLTHAMRSVEWIMRQVMFNKLWAQTFQLRKGNKWTAEECEIINGIEDISIRVLALGMTGAIRGINIDDHRPDFILGDDIIDEESAASAAQREKTEDLWFGALYNSLAPRSEAPHAMMGLLGTPIDHHDINVQCYNDPSWASIKCSKFNERGESSWPERWPTAELLAEKQKFINRNQISIWLREHECEIVGAENSTFRQEWLKYWDVLPERMSVYMAIDPVPPPSDRELRMDLRDKDSECIAVVGRHQGQVYLLEYAVHTGHAPDWTVAEFFRLVEKWKVRKCRVESVNYQRTLKWLLQQAMLHRQRYIQIDDVTDRRSKKDRITDSLLGVTSEGQFYCRPEQVEFIDQYSRYPKVPHDDVIEAVSVAVGAALEEDAIEMVTDDENDIYAALPDWRDAP